MDLDHGLDEPSFCAGCVCDDQILMGEHLHCPTCDAVMLPHPWAICGACSPGPAIEVAV